jgi:phytoene dehydrogenase-like protein
VAGPATRPTRRLAGLAWYNGVVQIAVIGAGLAGLAAAVEAERAGHDVVVVEASDGPGGRVRTDEVDGFRLDRGFQILLSAYPEAASLLDYDDLDLRAFAPGALIRWADRFHRVADPQRAPARLLDTIRAPIGTPVDKLRILAFRRAVTRGDLADLWHRPEVTARQRLEAAGFGPAIIDRFLGPLFAGITLDPDLGGSSRVLEFVFRMLATGDAVVPARGMGRIGDQLAGRLPPGALRLSTPVRAVEPGKVTTDDGEVIDADRIIVATDLDEAGRLTGVETRPWRGVTSVWLAADEPPLTEPILVLNGTGVGPVNSATVMSEVSPHYAPPDRWLVVASAPAIGGPTLVDGLRNQLRSWFGAAADGWEVLRVDEIERAQPVHPVGHDRTAALSTGDGIVVCGDHVRDPSINGAIGSGRAAARAVTAGSA